jgi:phage recombination protein Bet
MALEYCKRRDLDPFKRVVHIVPVWDSKRGREVETVWPGIAELRTTAARTGQYAGFDAAVFGPDITKKLGDREVTFPEWCQMTVYRIVSGIRCPFVGPKVTFLSIYQRASSKTSAPNAIWAKRPSEQLEKCAEAAALRRAFPEELGNEYAAEEMRGVDIYTVTDEPKRLEAGNSLIDEELDAIDGEAEEVVPALAAPDADAPEAAEQPFEAKVITAQMTEGVLLTQNLGAAMAAIEAQSSDPSKIDPDTVTLDADVATIFSRLVDGCKAPDEVSLVAQKWQIRILRADEETREVCSLLAKARIFDLRATDRMSRDKAAGRKTRQRDLR